MRPAVVSVHRGRRVVVQRGADQAQVPGQEV